VYMNRGGVMALIAVPSVLGAMLGSALGVRTLSKIKPSAVRWVVIVALILAGGRSLMKGLGL
jgi:uncharacterized membrane protein YfcA